MRRWVEHDPKRPLVRWLRLDDLRAQTPAGVKTDVVLLGVLDPTDGILTALPAGYVLSA